MVDDTTTHSANGGFRRFTDKLFWIIGSGFVMLLVWLGGSVWAKADKSIDKNIEQDIRIERMEGHQRILIEQQQKMDTKLDRVLDRLPK